MGNPRLGVDLAGTDLITTYQGDLALAEDKDNLRAAIMRRLSTPVGGLFSHPAYGNPVYDVLSEPMDSAWQGRAVAAINECLQQEPRISVESVDIDIDMEERKAIFSIAYLVLDEPGADNLVWEVELA